MYKRDDFIEGEFCSTWIQRDAPELFTWEDSPYIAGYMYPYQCHSCGLISQEKTPFCPYCGRAMNADAALEVKYRLDSWWKRELGDFLNDVK